MDTHGRLFYADVPAAVFGKRQPGAFHLTASGLAAQLQPDFVNLGKP
jgi:hypothetical protein